MKQELFFNALSLSLSFHFFNIPSTSNNITMPQYS